jgi:hypothetical protein
MSESAAAAGFDAVAVVLPLPSRCPDPSVCPVSKRGVATRRLSAPIGVPEHPPVIARVAAAKRSERVLTMVRVRKVVETSGRSEPNVESAYV